jgi:hypothetical protein
MSATITDSDTLNIVLDDSGARLYTSPPTSAIVTMEYHETMGNGNPNAVVTMEYHETMGNGDPGVFITLLYWETMVSVPHFHQVEFDTLDVNFSLEITKQYLHDSDTLNISIEENSPSELIDIAPKVLPINQTFVLLYAFGFGFNSTSQIVFNGVILPTTFVNVGTITAKIPNSLIAPLGKVNVNVINS